uniref:Uncharacterized protein n=1 Tax=Strigamia maritima TaxID=126957 RepID=T1J541_STRMM
MSEEEPVSEVVADEGGRKGPAKCFGGAPKRGSLIRVGFPCRTTGTARPTGVFACMGGYKKDLPCAPPLVGAGGGLPPGASGGVPGGDAFPPQGGALTKTCGVKAQFTGEIVIKKDVPPRPPGATQGGNKSAGKVKTCGSCEPILVCCPRRCPSPTHHHQAPMCQVPVFPNQPEITEVCRRILRSRGPDSSRYHPDCPCVCPTMDICEDDYEIGARDYEAPERLLHPGEEERFETVRTREEIVLDPQDDQCCHTQVLCDDQCAKYVRTEDTFRRTRCYNPPAECYPPPVLYCQPEVGCIRQCQECPPRCPGCWEGPPCWNDCCTNPTWARTLDCCQETPTCSPPCNPPAFSPQTEAPIPHYTQNVTSFPCGSN